MEKIPNSSVNHYALNKIDIWNNPCQIHHHDVLFGRGNGARRHLGNTYYHQLVVPKKSKYKKAVAVNRQEGKQVALDIIKKIRSLNPPGRFLVPDSLSSQATWYLAKEHRVLLKTCQALREIQKPRKNVYYNFSEVSVIDDKLCVVTKKKSNNGSNEEKDSRSTTKVSTQDDDSPSVSNISDLFVWEGRPKESSMDVDMLCNPQNYTNKLNSGDISAVRNSLDSTAQRSQQQSNTTPISESISNIQNCLSPHHLKKIRGGKILPFLTPIDPYAIFNSQTNDPTSLSPSNNSNVNKSSQLAPNCQSENVMAEANLITLNKASQIKEPKKLATSQVFDLDTRNTAQSTINGVEKNNTPCKDSIEKKFKYPSLSTFKISEMNEKLMLMEEPSVLKKKNVHSFTGKAAEVATKPMEERGGSALSGSEYSNLSIMNQSLEMLNQACVSSMETNANFPQGSKGIISHQVKNSTSGQVNSASCSDQRFIPNLNQKKTIEAAAMSLLMKAIQDKWSKGQLADVLFHLLSTQAAFHKPDPEADKPLTHVMQDSFQAVSPLCSEPHFVDIGRNISREKVVQASGCDSSSTPLHTQDKDITDAINDLSKQINNATQCDQQIPETCISNGTLTTRRASNKSSLKSNEQASALGQKQSNEPKELTTFDLLMEGAKSKKNQQQPFVTTDAARFDESNSGNMNASSAQECPGSKATTLNFSVISRDDELEDKRKILKSEKHTGKNQNDFKKFIMPLSYIGRSFSNHRLNGVSNVTDETKTVFEELSELKDKGDGAPMHLPSVIGSLCQRIIDLEEELLL